MSCQAGNRLPSWEHPHHYSSWGSLGWRQCGQTRLGGAYLSEGPFSETPLSPPVILFS